MKWRMSIAAFFRVVVECTECERLIDTRIEPHYRSVGRGTRLCRECRNADWFEPDPTDTLLLVPEQRKGMGEE
jgi:hypothetical protein